MMAWTIISTKYTSYVNQLTQPSLLSDLINTHKVTKNIKSSFYANHSTIMVQQLTLAQTKCLALHADLARSCHVTIPQYISQPFYLDQLCQRWYFATKRFPQVTVMNQV